MPPRPALTFDAHSIHRSSENGKLFTHSLHTGFPQFGHSLVDVSVLHNVQILFFIIIITPSKAKSISHIYAVLEIWYNNSKQKFKKNVKDNNCWVYVDLR